MQMSRRSGSAAAPRSPFLPLNFFFFFLLFSSFFPLIIIFICCCWILLFSLSHNTWNVSARSIRRTWIVLIEFFFVGIGSQSRKAFDLQMFPLAQLPAKDSLGLAGILFPRLVAPPPAQGRLILRNQSDKRRFRINGAGGLSQLRPPFLEIPCHFLLPFASIFGDSSPSLPSLPSPNLEIYIIEAISIEFPQCLFVLFLLLLLLLFFFLLNLFEILRDFQAERRDFAYWIRCDGSGDSRDSGSLRCPSSFSQSKDRVVVSLRRRSSRSWGTVRHCSCLSVWARFSGIPLARGCDVCVVLAGLKSPCFQRRFPK